MLELAVNIIKVQTKHLNWFFGDISYRFHLSFRFDLKNVSGHFCSADMPP